MQIIRILLAEDHHIVRAAVASFLKNEPDFEVVGEVSHGNDLLGAVARYHPDVLLLDARMPGPRVIDSVRDLRRQHEDVKILILSRYKRREYVEGLLREGIHGYMLKDDAPEMLAKAVRLVYAGQEYFSPQVSRLMAEGLKLNSSLTRRELQTLLIVAQGKTNEELAAEMNITEQTAKNYVGRMMRKIGVKTRVEVVVFAYEHGLVPISEDVED